MFAFTALPPLALYIHLPWCVRKCPYCDFNSHEAKHELPERAYVDALLRDLEESLPRVWGRTIYSVFIGGGTPSLLSPEAIDTLLTGVRARLPVSAGAEITLEANPGTVDEQRFTGFRQAGVNRLSVGIQSFSSPLLERISRIHDGAQSRRAVEAALRAGFDNFNLDLMFGLPGQSVAEALADIATAIELQPRHISLYQLTLEPNTAFAHTPPVLPDDDACWEMQTRGIALLAQHGYARYEVSAYARSGSTSLHNLNYWTFGDYLGIGAGAHGKITDAHTQTITRAWKRRHPREYLDQPGPAGEKVLTPDDAVLEFMMNALRLTGGFTTELFTERTGLPPDWIGAALEAAKIRGMIEWDGYNIRPTAFGMNFLNDLVQLFLTPDQGSAAQHEGIR
ncbi:MAG: oxygen-independent coproporphyrinogen III oxidase [Gammaproteobacteria bacterium]|nr:MAG: oxygen-independent coproporphyrinogen III oxidase [Gammaproteobacteria bacterium]TND02912.1 MAG: oxygen-independent coproporphyrinogen III oxidase [Gammaproteobacteria bacterium]